MFNKFTERARKILVLAKEEARRFNHDYIGTEHILLGLLHEGEGVACAVLQNLGIDLERLRMEIEKLISPGSVASVWATYRLLPGQKKRWNWPRKKPTTWGIIISVRNIYF